MRAQTGLDTPGAAFTQPGCEEGAFAVARAVQGELIDANLSRGACGAAAVAQSRRLPVLGKLQPDRRQGRSSLVQSIVLTGALDARSCQRPYCVLFRRFILNHGVHAQKMGVSAPTGRTPRHFLAISD